MIEAYLNHPENFSLDSDFRIRRKSFVSSLLTKCLFGRRNDFYKNALIFCHRLDQIEKGRGSDIPDQFHPLVLDLIDQLEGTEIAETLQEKWFGYRYRNEKQVPFEDAALVFNAFAKAEEWKQKEVFFWDKTLTSEEKGLIAPLVRKYGRIFRWILACPDREKQLWTWLIRDQLPASIFFEFPSLRNRIIDAKMTGRLGRTGILRLKKDDSGLKKVVMLVEGEEVDIRDPMREVILREDWILSIDEIFQIFKNKAFFPGNLEAFESGISNWNSHLMARWNPHQGRWISLPLSQENWWEFLPCLEALTSEQVKARYGIEKGNWGVLARATREKPNLDYENTHAYIELIIPLGEGSHYRVFPLGKFARKFPKNFLELMQTFSAVVPGTIAYPDENVYCTERQHVGFVFEISPEKGLEGIDFIKKEIEKARAHKMGYQIATENCGRWVQKVLEAVVDKDELPNLYYTSLIDAEPRGVMSSIFSWIRRLRPEFRAIALNAIHYPWGSWKGTWILEKEGEEVFKIITKSSFWRDTLVHLPAYLHENHNEEILQNRASLTYERKQERLVKRI